MKQMRVAVDGERVLVSFEAPEKEQKEILAYLSAFLTEGINGIEKASYKEGYVMEKTELPEELSDKAPECSVPEESQHNGMSAKADPGMQDVAQEEDITQLKKKVKEKLTGTLPAMKIVKILTESTVDELKSYL